MNHTNLFEQHRRGYSRTVQGETSARSQSLQLQVQDEMSVSVGTMIATVPTIDYDSKSTTERRRMMIVTNATSVAPIGPHMNYSPSGIDYDNASTSRKDLVIQLAPRQVRRTRDSGKAKQDPKAPTSSLVSKTGDDTMTARLFQRTDLIMEVSEVSNTSNHDGKNVFQDDTEEQSGDNARSFKKRLIARVSATEDDFVLDSNRTKPNKIPRSHRNHTDCASPVSSFVEESSITGHVPPPVPYREVTLPADLVSANDEGERMDRIRRRSTVPKPPVLVIRPSTRSNEFIAPDTTGKRSCYTSRTTRWTELNRGYVPKSIDVIVSNDDVDFLKHYGNRTVNDALEKIIQEAVPAFVHTQKDGSVEQQYPILQSILDAVHDKGGQFIRPVRVAVDEQGRDDDDDDDSVVTSNWMDDGESEDSTTLRGEIRWIKASDVLAQLYTLKHVREQIAASKEKVHESIVVPHSNQ